MNIPLNERDKKFCKEIVETMHRYGFDALAITAPREDGVHCWYFSEEHSKWEGFCQGFASFVGRLVLCQRCGHPHETSQHPKETMN